MNRLLLLIVLLASACAPSRQGPVTLTVMTHDSFSISETVVRSFEDANQASVSFLKSGDTGAALNKAILARNAPLADVFFGVDNTFITRALDADLFEPYASPALAAIPSEFRLDPGNRALPVDYGDVCINYDKAFFASAGLAVPERLEDLVRPEYRGLLVTENPASSSPGLAFLLATVRHFGDPGYLDYWKDLRENGVVVVDGWETAYYTAFSGSSGQGPQPMVVSYATSPAAEVMFASSPLTDSPTASIIGPDTCFRQIEFVGILKGTPHVELARRFVDFMLSAEFQSDIPGQMFVYPVHPGVSLPEEFTNFAQVAAKPATLPPAEIALNREEWIKAWTDAVLR